MMASQSFKDGFADGWSDQCNGRVKAEPVERAAHAERFPDSPLDQYAREYAKGYIEGARAYGQRLEGRSGGSQEAVA